MTEKFILKGIDPETKEEVYMLNFANGARETTKNKDLAYICYAEAVAISIIEIWDSTSRLDKTGSNSYNWKVVVLEASDER